jgi:hypothetical protein
MKGIPAITIWQPWASLIAAGVKPFEFRKWSAPPWVRHRRIGIHAGARPVKRVELHELILKLRHDQPGTGLRREALELLEAWAVSPGMLPLSSVLCTALLGQPRLAMDLFRGTVSDSDRIAHQIWAWPLSDIEVLEPFEPVVGAQGFWRWEPRVAGAPEEGEAPHEQPVS